MIDIDFAIRGMHIVSGAVAVLLGAIALAAPKGGIAHVRAGRYFVLAMLLSSAIGGGLGLSNIDEFYITFHAAVLCLTLIASAWLAVRSKGPTSASSMLAAANMINAIALILLGLHALEQPSMTFCGFHAEDYFLLSCMALIAFVCDALYIFRKHISYRHKVTRHLWRMCMGFFIAAGSAFTGPGATAFPESVRNSGVLAAPELIIAVLMFYWLAKTLFTRSALTKAR